MGNGQRDLLFPEPLARALASCRSHLRYAALFSALLNLLFLVPMLYMLQVYDRVVPTRGGTTLLFLTLVLAGSLATLAALDMIRSRLLVRASARLDRELSAEVLAACLSDRGAGPALRRTAMRDYDSLRQALTGPAILALFDAPWAPVYILVCFVIHPAIGVMALAGSGIMALLAWLNEKRTREPLEQAGRATALAHASQDFSFSAADTVAALGMRDSLVARHGLERRVSLATQLGASFQGGQLAAISKFMRLLLQSLGLGLGAWLAINNQISGGAIFAASFLIGRAMAPVDQLIAHWNTIVKARSSLATLTDLFGAAAVDVALTRLPSPEGSLSAESITLAGPRQERPLLDNVNFALRPGEMLAVVGASGAGKSTLARVLAGATQPDDGTVRFDGADRRDWPSEELARHLGFMPQEPTLFAGTIKENIARFQTAATPEESETLDEMAVAAAKAAGVHELILRLPQGYDYRLELGGRGLSMGQSQRISLARALFGEPRYLVLDEPNAHFDPESDQQFAGTLARLKQGGTTIVVVAHRLTFMPIVDKLLVMRDGRVEISGPRDEVLQRLTPPRTVNTKVGAAAPTAAAPTTPPEARADSSADAPSTGSPDGTTSKTSKAPAK